MSVETNENINSVNGNIYNPENIVKDVITPNTGEVTTDTIVVDFQATQRINILSELLKDEVARGNQQGIISQKNGMLNNDNNNVIPLNKQDNELITNIINSSSENSAEQLAQSENFSNADLSNKNVLETPNETIEQKNNENTQDILQNTDVADFESEANLKVYYNMPPLDERKRNGIINDLLIRLGLINSSGSSNDNQGRIFGLFRR